MAQLIRRNYSAEEGRELWQRWVAGESVSSISVSLNRKPGTIHSTLSLFGGIAPIPKKRPAMALREEEREEISRGISRGESLRQIAFRLARSVSTITREINRNVDCKSPIFVCA